MTLPDASSPNPKDSLGALKVPLNYTPEVARIWWALAQKDGAYKYGEANWRNKPVRMSVYLEAMDRHRALMKAGQDVDSKSGLPHTGHIMACCAIIEDARACGCLIDDRLEKDGTVALLEALTSDNYDVATLALTRTPARQLGELNGGPLSTGQLVDAYLAKQAETKAKTDAAAEAQKAAEASVAAGAVTAADVGLAAVEAALTTSKPDINGSDEPHPALVP